MYRTRAAPREAWQAPPSQELSQCGLDYTLATKGLGQVVTYNVAEGTVWVSGSDTLNVWSQWAFAGLSFVPIYSLSCLLLLQHGMGREYAGVLCKSSERYQDIVYLNAKVLQKLLEVNRGPTLAMGINFGNTGGWAGVYQFGLTGQRIITGPGA